jgi:hypothetical protein
MHFTLYPLLFVVVFCRGIIEPHNGFGVSQHHPVSISFSNMPDYFAGNIKMFSGS